MGEARRRAEVENEAQAAGIAVPPKPPKTTVKSWEFRFNEEAYADFSKVYAYLQKRMGDHGPQRENDLAEKCLALGLKFFIGEIRKEQQRSGVQLHTPADMAEASKRLQAIKQGVK